MATIDAISEVRKDMMVVTWTNLVQATSDVGAAADLGQYGGKRSAQAFGTNATTVQIQGSNDGTNWDALGAGVTLTIGAGGTSPITDLPAMARYLRPATPSAAADTDVVIVGYK